MFNLEACPAYPAKNLGIAVRAVPFACQEEIHLSGQFHLWQHLMPDVSQQDQHAAYAERKPLLDGTELLMTCDSHTAQLIANLHFMIPVVEEIIQMRYMI
jgi:hypothetical protein